MFNYEGKKKTLLGRLFLRQDVIDSSDHFGRLFFIFLENCIYKHVFSYTVVNKYSNLNRIFIFFKFHY